jgi:hypothetical protein
MSTPPCRHLLDACSGYFVRFSLWRRPPTRHATLCNDAATVFHGGAPCPNRTIRESVRWSACGWRQIACNWRGTFRILLRSHISFGSREYGPTWRFEERMRMLERKADTQTQSRNNRVIWPARELHDSNCQRRYELAIICSLKV